MSGKENGILDLITNLSFKKKILLLITIIIICLIPLLIISSIFIYNSIFSPYWDGGKWETAYPIPTEEYNYKNGYFIEYKGLIYCFFSIETKNTYTGGDDIGMNEYSLSDIAFKTFDGKNWGKEIILTNSSDETSVQISYPLVYEDRIIFIYEQNERYNNQNDDWDNIWNTSIELWSFNGNTIEFYRSIWNESERKNITGSPQIICNSNELFVISKTSSYYEDYGLAIKRISGNITSKWEYFKFSDGFYNIDFTIYNNQIWLIWSAGNEDIYIGQLNEKEINNILLISGDDDEENKFRPEINTYGDKIFGFWEWGPLYKTYSNGSLSKMNRVGYAGCQIFSYCFKDKLYLIWMEPTMGDRCNHIIKSYNGEEWSKAYKTTTWSLDGSDYPYLFGFKDSLFVYWTPYNIPYEDSTLYIREFKINY